MPQNEPTQNVGFFSYCAKNGLELLREDKIFLLKHKYLLTKPVLREYERLWFKGMEEEPVLHKKQNAGRFKANQYFCDIIHNFIHS